MDFWRLSSFEHCWWGYRHGWSDMWILNCIIVILKEMLNLHWQGYLRSVTLVEIDILYEQCSLEQVTVEQVGRSAIRRNILKTLTSQLVRKVQALFPFGSLWRDWALLIWLTAVACDLIAFKIFFAYTLFIYQITLLYPHLLMRGGIDLSIKFCHRNLSACYKFARMILDDTTYSLHGNLSLLIFDQLINVTISWLNRERRLMWKSIQFDTIQSNTSTTGARFTSTLRGSFGTNRIAACWWLEKYASEYIRTSSTTHGRNWPVRSPEGVSYSQYT